VHRRNVEVVFGMNQADVVFGLAVRELDGVEVSD
jgi:hypothetical protein